MNLFNSNPVPAGLRKCFWHPEHIAEMPFCLVAKLSEQQKKDLAVFEDQKYMERLEQLEKESLYGEFDYEENEPKSSVMQRAEMALLGLGSCNTQTSSGLPEKTALKRSQYLSR